MCARLMRRHGRGLACACRDPGSYANLACMVMHWRVECQWLYALCEYDMPLNTLTSSVCNTTLVLIPPYTMPKN